MTMEKFRKLGKTDRANFFVGKSLLMEQLTAKMKHIQTNNHLFLVISE